MLAERTGACCVRAGGRAREIRRDRSSVGSQFRKLRIDLLKLGASALISASVSCGALAQNGLDPL